MTQTFRKFQLSHEVRISSFTGKQISSLHNVFFFSIVALNEDCSSRVVERRSLLDFSQDTAPSCWNWDSSSLFVILYAFIKWAMSICPWEAIKIAYNSCYDSALPSWENYREIKRITEKSSGKLDHLRALFPLDNDWRMEPVRKKVRRKRTYNYTNPLISGDTTRPSNDKLLVHWTIIYSGWDISPLRNRTRHGKRIFWRKLEWGA